MSPRRVAVPLAALLFAAAAAAQGDASRRLRTLPGTPRAAVYDWASGTLRPPGGPTGFAGPDVVYNNSCLPAGAMTFAVLGPMESVVDNGRVPSSSSPQPAGCNDVLRMDGFTVGYCTDHPSVDVQVAFYELHEHCAPLATAGGSVKTFLLPNLPGSATAVPVCWTIAVDLTGTSDEWPFQADGDGVFQGDAQDTFGVQIGFLSPPSPLTGVLLAGDPVHLGQGCDFAVGTVYQEGDPTSSAPMGTGLGSTDSIAFAQQGSVVGCFDFGGWPSAPWASAFLQVRVPDARCNPPVYFCSPDGGQHPLGPPIACPCGNDPPIGPPQGCLHSGALGGKITTHPTSGFSITGQDLVLIATDLAVGNGGLFFVGTGELAMPMPLFDGVLCVGGSALVAGGTLRLNPGFETAPGTRVSNPPGATSLLGEAATIAPGFFVAGVLYYWQYFFRDAAPGPGPCGGMANFTNGIALILGP